MLLHTRCACDSGLSWVPLEDDDCRLHLRCARPARVVMQKHSRMHSSLPSSVGAESVQAKLEAASKYVEEIPFFGSKTDFCGHGQESVGIVEEVELAAKDIKLITTVLKCVATCAPHGFLLEELTDDLPTAFCGV